MNHHKIVVICRVNKADKNCGLNGCVTAHATPPPSKWNISVKSKVPVRTSPKRNAPKQIWKPNRFDIIVDAHLSKWQIACQRFCWHSRGSNDVGYFGYTAHNASVCVHNERRGLDVVRGWPGGSSNVGKYIETDSKHGVETPAIESLNTSRVTAGCNMCSSGVGERRGASE